MSETYGYEDEAAYEDTSYTSDYTETEASYYSEEETVVEEYVPEDDPIVQEEPVPEEEPEEPAVEEQPVIEGQPLIEAYIPEEEADMAGQPEHEPSRSVEGPDATATFAEETTVYGPEPMPPDEPGAELSADDEADLTAVEEPGLYDMPATGYASTGWWASTEEPCHCCVVPADVADVAPERRPAELAFTSGGETSAVAGYDGNGDGTVDIAGLDANGDGRVDTWLVDPTGEGVAGVMLIDTNGDGVPDAVSFDQGGAGSWSAPATLSSLPVPSAVAPTPPDIGNYSTLFDQEETVTIGGHPAGAYANLFQPSVGILLSGTDGSAYAGLFDSSESFAISPAGLSGPLLNLVNAGAWTPYPDNPNTGPEIPTSSGRDAAEAVDLGATREISLQNFRGLLNGLYG